MGTQFRYVCPGCGYSAKVSGGSDAGELSLTQTVHCADCGRLYDVVVQDRLNHPGREHPLACPASARHIVRLWAYPGPCPKCGVTMERGEMTLLWD